MAWASQHWCLGHFLSSPRAWLDYIGIHIQMSSMEGFFFFFLFFVLKDIFIENPGSDLERLCWVWPSFKMADRVEMVLHKNWKERGGCLQMLGKATGILSLCRFSILLMRRVNAKHLSSDICTCFFFLFSWYFSISNCQGGKLDSTNARIWGVLHQFLIFLCELKGFYNY